MDRFWSKVDVRGSDECWPWTAGIKSDGYGRFLVGSRLDGTRKAALSHRVAYELAIGPLSTGLQVDHLCHNRDESCPAGVCEHRLCCNPNHLEAVSASENQRRGRSFSGVNARKTHCPRRHPYDESNTYVDSAGGRRCRQCDRERRAA